MSMLEEAGRGEAGRGGARREAQVVPVSRQGDEQRD